MAVLSVILFHAGFDWIRGGYLGVDVFFVISGYLITTIILGDIDNRRFTLQKFYERRARRILPALFLVLLVCWIAGVLWLMPHEFRQLNKSSLATIFFVPNLYFWKNTRYFSPSADTIPLLHTWSLGVEEQFYFVFPWLVLLALRRGTSTLVATIVLLFLVSLGLAEWAWRVGKSAAAFFLTPTRGWELMAGALVAVFLRSGWRKSRALMAASASMSMAGLLLLMTCFVLFSSDTPMPSVIGTIPIMATCMIILSTGSSGIGYWILSSRPMVTIGLISYSAYLWHQPILAFYRLVVGQPGLGMRWVLILLVLALAHATWKFVEGPFRDRSRISTVAMWRSTALAGVVLAAASLAGVMTRGLDYRLSSDQKLIANVADPDIRGAYVSRRFESLEGGRFSADERVKLLVIGDSFAQDFVNMTFEAGYGSSLDISTVRIDSDCQIYLGGDEAVLRNISPKDRPKCELQHSLARMRERLREADAVVLAGSWSLWAVPHIKQTIEALMLGPDQKLIVVGTKSFGRPDFRALINKSSEDRLTSRGKPKAETEQVNSMLRRLVAVDNYVDVQSIVCASTGTCQMFTQSKELISFDGFHLTEAGAKWIGVAIWGKEPLVNLVNAGVH